MLLSAKCAFAPVSRCRFRNRLHIATIPFGSVVANTEHYKVQPGDRGSHPLSLDMCSTLAP